MTTDAMPSTSPHRDGPQYHGARTTRLYPMTANTPELIAATSRCIRAAFKPGFRLVKCGVILHDLMAAKDAPRGLFDAPSPNAIAAMTAMDGLNAKFGRGTVFMAAVGTKRGWKLRSEHHSPCYTTRLAEVPVARA